MKVVNKPWGYYRDLHRDSRERFVLKKIVVHAGQKLSLQVHRKRREVWYVMNGSGWNEGDVPRALRSGDVVVVERGEVHRIVAGSSGLFLLELQVGVCWEDDIRRLSDDYGRVDA